ncbi:hypothetical protein DASC09_031320 [Saccharomycopsis crataegensis]|uniref:Uncharacterized protein n=1 Tax=Saccharomycopsis crataegensis TaxID=43959 RepID=A0AAV5QMG5_9ASCO|nr:hypothetical protein DASC09_031320 [Saccharomycopsis crataegensis]
MTQNSTSRLSKFRKRLHTISSEHAQEAHKDHDKPDTNNNKSHSLVGQTKDHNNEANDSLLEEKFNAISTEHSSPSSDKILNDGDYAHTFDSYHNAGIHSKASFDYEPSTNSNFIFLDKNGSRNSSGSSSLSNFKSPRNLNDNESADGNFNSSDNETGIFHDDYDDAEEEESDSKSSIGSFENRPSLFTKLKVYDDEDCSDDERNIIRCKKSSPNTNVLHVSQSQYFQNNKIVSDDVNGTSDDNLPEFKLTETGIAGSKVPSNTLKISSPISAQKTPTSLTFKSLEQQSTNQLQIINSPYEIHTKGSNLTLTLTKSNSSNYSNVQRHQKIPYANATSANSVYSNDIENCSPLANDIISDTVSTKDNYGKKAQLQKFDVCSIQTSNSNLNNPTLSFINEFNSQISNQTILTVDQYNRLIAGGKLNEPTSTNSLEINSSDFRDLDIANSVLITSNELAYYYLNKLPGDTILYSKYFLFKIINSKRRCSIIQNPQGDSKLYGEFLSSGLFLPRNCWILPSIGIKNCKIKENILNELIVFLNSFYTNLIEDESFNFNSINASLLYYKKLLLAFNVYDKNTAIPAAVDGLHVKLAGDSTLADDNQSYYSVDDRQSLSNVSHTNVGTESLHSKLANISHKKSTPNLRKHKRFSSFHFYKRNKSKSKNSTALLQQNENENVPTNFHDSKSVTSERTGVSFASPSVSTFGNPSTNDNINTSSNEEKEGYFNVLTSLFEIVSKLTNYAMHLQYLIETGESNDNLDLKFDLALKILKFLAKYVIQFILIDMVNLINDHMRLSSEFFKSGILLDDVISSIS